MNIEMKRVYEPPLPKDGQRILIDRLWPRGVSKQVAHIDIWMKEIAPSSVLRTWFGHVPEKFPEFKLRYVHELEAEQIKQELAGQILQIAEAGKVTLVYAAKDPLYNHANVLKHWLLAVESRNKF